MPLLLWGDYFVIFEYVDKIYLVNKECLSVYLE